MNDSSPSKAAANVAEGTGPSACVFQAMLRGGVGFALVSVGGFAVWAFAGKWLGAHVGEAGLYVACLIVFVALSGLALHPLVRGPKPLIRFYKIFLPAFAVYAVAWCAAWFALRFGPGEWLGSLAGSLVLAVMIGRGLGVFRSFIKVSVVLFVLHSTGYFSGGWFMRWLMSVGHGRFPGAEVSAFAKLGWGLLYGLGVGAGLGYAFCTYQNESALAPATRQN